MGQSAGRGSKEKAVLGDGALTFREFAMQEPVPLATIQAAILGLLRSRDDAVLFGAQAVNAYCDEPRMTQDVDVLSLSARALAEEIRAQLADRFHLAIRVRELGSGRDFRVFQVRKPRNRHLADVRSVEELPPAQRIGGILVATVPELIARKLLAYQRRKGQPKSGTDWRDLAVLLLAFPELKTEAGAVGDRLRALGAREDDMAAWRALVAEAIRAEPDENDEA
jgi:hypothetical protein